MAAFGRSQRRLAKRETASPVDCNDFEFLDQPGAGMAASLCGRNAVQVRPVSKSERC